MLQKLYLLFESNWLTFKEFMKHHPLISFFLIFVGTYLTAFNFTRNIDFSKNLSEISYMVFTPYVAQLRGRSAWWWLAPFGLIIVSFLPIKTRES